MMTATFADNGKRLSMQVEGHAEYASVNDIVCAAGSMLGQALIGTLGGIEGISYETHVSPGHLSVSCTNNADTLPMFLLCRVGFGQLAQTYPKNVSVRGEIG